MTSIESHPIASVAGERIPAEPGELAHAAISALPRSSSMTAIPVYDADVRRDQVTVGPVRLPEEHSPSFIQAFNRTYEAYGLTIQPRPMEP